MILIWTCWYLCVMFLVVLVGSSFISVASGGEIFIATIRGVSFAFAIGCVLLTLILKRKFRSNPDSPVFRSKAVSGICIAIAAILTLIFVGGIIG